MKIHCTIYLGTFAASVHIWSMQTSGVGGSTVSANVLSTGDVAREIGVLAHPAGDLLVWGDGVWRRYKLAAAIEGDCERLNIYRNFDSLTSVFHSYYFKIFCAQYNFSHFSYACKMQYPLNLVLENCEYLWFYWTFCIVIFRLWFETT